MNQEAENSCRDLPQRKSLPHEIPDWVKPGALFFITICCTPRGQNQLCTPTASTAIFESVAHRHRNGDWFARLVVLMPDHLHALLAFPPRREMQKTVRLWKAFLARQHGIRWQRDFFDHRLRNDEAMEEKAHYIRLNPVRAKLIEESDKWPYLWES